MLRSPLKNMATKQSTQFPTARITVPKTGQIGKCLTTHTLVVLHQSDDQQELKHLLPEAWSSALLDCDASKTHCGKDLPIHQQSTQERLRQNPIL